MNETADTSAVAGDRRPVWWALSVAIVVLTLAVSYRIVKTDGDIDVQGTKDGIQVKITQAQQTIDSAQSELAELSKQLDERQANLGKAEADLLARQAKVAEMLAALEPNPSNTKPRTTQLKMVEEQLKTLRATPPPTPSATVAPEVTKARVAKLSELQQKLVKTSAELKAAQRPQP